MKKPPPKKETLTLKEKISKWISEWIEDWDNMPGKRYGGTNPFQPTKPRPELIIAGKKLETSFKKKGYKKWKK